MKKITESIRREYTSEGLELSSLPENPIILFEDWLKQAIEKGITDPNAMILSTVSAEHHPSSRVVLLKAIDKTGLVFYTNYESRKAREIATNTSISAVFLWTVLERQVRIEGTAEKVDEKTSDEYFATRPRDSQIAAWASPQSQEISNREELANRFKEYEKKFEGKDIKRPEHWGGFKIIPSYFEFWQGRTGRLNDRVSYRLRHEKWIQSWLAPSLHNMDIFQYKLS